MEAQFIRTKGFAEMLGVSNSKAHEIVKAGRVRSIWLDHNRLIPIEDARAFVEVLKQQEATEPSL